MWGCQLALAEAHVPTSVSLLPILSSSCLCFATPKKRATFRTQKWVAIQLEAQLTNSWLLFWADGLGGCLSVKRALNCDNERRSSMVFVRSVAKMLVSQYICLTNLITYNCLNLFYFGTKKRKGVQRKHTDGGLKTCQGTLLGQSQGGSSLGVAEQASLDVGEGCPPATPQRAPAVLGWKRDWETGAPNQLAVGNTWGYHGDIMGISLKLPLYHRSCWRSHWRHFFGQSLITESASGWTEQNPRTPSAVGLQDWIILSFGDWAMIAYPIPSLGWCHHLPQ